MTLIKTHGSEARGQETTKRTPQLKNARGYYCELFTCRDGFAILALNYAIIPIRNVLYSRRRDCK